MPAHHTGTQRRVRALMALGHTEGAIALDAGIDWQTVAAIALGALTDPSPHVTEAIAATFRRLELTPGKDWAVAKDARVRGWSVPFGWDEEEFDPETGLPSPHWIDDPDAYANTTGICGTRNGRDRHIRMELPVCQPCKTAYSRPRSNQKERQQAAA